MARTDQRKLIRALWGTPPELAASPAVPGPDGSEGPDTGDDDLETTLGLPMASEDGEYEPATPPEPVTGTNMKPRKRRPSGLA